MQVPCCTLDKWYQNFRWWDPNIRFVVPWEISMATKAGNHYCEKEGGWRWRSLGSERLLCEPHPGRSFQWLMVKSDSESCLKFYTNQGLIFFSRLWVPQRVFVCAQPSPTWCDPMDCSLPGSSIHRILQVRILEWIAISFSRGSSWPRDWTHVFASPALAGGLFTTGSSGKPLFGEQLMVIHRGWWQWLWWGW